MKKKSGLTRFLLLLLLACVTLNFFVSCDNNEVVEETDSIKVDSSIANKIVDDGKAIYTVVYPKNASPTLRKAVDYLVSSIESATGVRLPSKSDEKKRSEIYDSSAKEILVGATGYDETQSVLSQLRNGQFAVKEEKNKLVIVSKPAEDIELAVRYFCDELLSDNVLQEASGKKSLLIEEFVSEPDTTTEDAEVNDALVCGVKLSEYAIVYDSSENGYWDAAKNLQAYIQALYNVRLPIYVDSAFADDGSRQILIGKTNRQLSNECYSATIDIMSYKILVEGNKIQVVSGGPFSALQAVSELGTKISQLTADGEYFKTDLITETPDLTDGADVRIMTANILADRWVANSESDAVAPKTPCVEARAEILAGILTAYKPDAVGLQEACDIWVKALPKYLDILKNDYGLEYTWLHNSYNDKLNMTSVLYRSDKYDVVRSAVQPVSYWDSEGKNYYIRDFTYVQLKNRTNSGEEFMLINTHWALSSQLEQVQMCINEEIELINTLRKYGVPIVCTGDFNSKQDTDDYYRFTREADVLEMRVVAAENGALINSAGGCGSVGSPRSSNSGNYIDHIYGTSECDALRYETVLKNMAYWMTDHSPQYSDIKFK